MIVFPSLAGEFLKQHLNSGPLMFQSSPGRDSDSSSCNAQLSVFFFVLPEPISQYLPMPLAAGDEVKTSCSSHAELNHEEVYIVCWLVRRCVHWDIEKSLQECDRARFNSPGGLGKISQKNISFNWVEATTVLPLTLPLTIGKYGSLAAWQWF